MCYILAVLIPRPHVSTGVLEPCVRCSRLLKIRTRGLCAGCYEHIRRQDQLDSYPRRGRWSDTESLERSKASDGECWLWQGHITKDGYGRSTTATQAHRWVYESLVRLLTDDETLDHECHNRDVTCRGGSKLCRHRACVNPGHMAVKTRAANTLASSKTPASINLGKTMCKRGNPLSGTNLKVQPDGHRNCRACQAIHSRNARYRRVGLPPLA